MDCRCSWSTESKFWSYYNNYQPVTITSLVAMALEGDSFDQAYNQNQICLQQLGAFESESDMMFVQNEAPSYITIKLSLTLGVTAVMLQLSTPTLIVTSRGSTESKFCPCRKISV